jgi:hypothetical protein
MLCILNSETLEFSAEVFEILTPIVLFFWFFYSRWTKSKTEYFKEIAGNYGAFIPGVTRAPLEGKTYMSGMTMKIFDIDNNGYFRGQFDYYEEETTPGWVGGPNATSQIVQSSINFITGRLSFKWNLSPFKKRNPLLWKTNRIYNGEMTTVDRLDLLAETEDMLLERVYNIKHHRESRVIEFTLERVNKQNHNLPSKFILLKSFDHLLDPYKNVDLLFRLHYLPKT